MLTYIGRSKNHKLCEEICLGKNAHLVENGRCDYLDSDDKSCVFLRDDNVQSMVPSDKTRLPDHVYPQCLFPLFVMAINEIWAANNPISREVQIEAVVLQLKHERFSLAKPGITSLYKRIEKIVWRNATRNRNRKICGNCGNFPGDRKWCGSMDKIVRRGDSARGCELFSYFYPELESINTGWKEVGADPTNILNARAGVGRMINRLKNRAARSSDPRLKQTYIRRYECCKLWLQLKDRGKTIKVIMTQFGVSRDRVVKDMLEIIRELKNEL